MSIHPNFNLFLTFKQLCLPMLQYEHDFNIPFWEVYFQSIFNIRFRKHPKQGIDTHLTCQTRSFGDSKEYKGPFNSLKRRLQKNLLLLKAEAEIGLLS